MKRMFALTLALVALTGLTLACSSDDDKASTDGDTAAKVYSDPSKAIEVAEGDTFTIELESNVSTGYEWTVTSEPDAAVATVDNPAGTVVQADNADGAVGKPGTTNFTLTAKGAGSTEVTFTYARSFDPEDDPSESTFTIKVS